MKLSGYEKQRLLKAKRKVKRIKMFYLHFALYLVSMALILYNFWIIEEGPYKNNIISLNLSIIVAWTVFILVHGFVVFKERSVFNKNWEDKKISEFTKEREETEQQLWE